MNIKEAKIGDKVWVEGIINSSFSNGGVHVNHAGVDAFYDLERTKIKPDGYAGQSPKYLKNIIAKMRELPEHDRAVWIKGIFKEFGIENDISYYLGHKQGVLQAKDSLKPEVPQYLADWYEKHKDNLEYYIWEYIAEWDNQEKDDFFVFMNFSVFKPIQTLVNMHQFGYTIKKEKLYTVEIPNPNAKQIALRLEKWVEGKVRIVATYSSNNFTDYMRLTEREIRKDFDWAWQFAEEVTG
ncbi:TPA: DUF1642 domain-containing protein [Streptococcus pyogenes]|uniref:DUF1642 domain-containing protein n=2 Tax=Streptococcus pyogenes TaxID=1314 RepID=UPI00109C32D5|nr:DUF1642 domain-containing protein [Streptococcus pyogenes]VGW14569.1 phage protein [Streptococcus pyogenes]HEQ2961439.1 DUF1642 domain-containing protein [Streptococcus pyogenes]HEQ2969646.1 DUF1642 domain-containing protein [Streptococcus pyogenes]HEQ2984254.1 DUF1642 domain-containing protein [Streptococcus pyogenes]HEQ2987351.1 DUF1642 domain-containing protein [Streptococcus pyogenes]